MLASHWLIFGARPIGSCAASHQLILWLQYSMSLMCFVCDVGLWCYIFSSFHQAAVAHWYSHGLIIRRLQVQSPSGEILFHYNYLYSSNFKKLQLFNIIYVICNFIYEKYINSFPLWSILRFFYSWLCYFNVVINFTIPDLVSTSANIFFQKKQLKYGPQKNIY